MLNKIFNIVLEFMKALLKLICCHQNWKAKRKAGKPKMPFFVIGHQLGLSIAWLIVCQLPSLKKRGFSIHIKHPIIQQIDTRHTMNFNSIISNPKLK